jgi:hypothetical protein
VREGGGGGGGKWAHKGLKGKRVVRYHTSIFIIFMLCSCVYVCTGVLVPT